MTSIPYEPSVEVQSAVAELIIRGVVGDATGEADGDRCFGEPPSARYFLGTLAPIDLDLSTGTQRRGRETPKALGFEFEITRPEAVLDLRATMSCYFKVLPTFKEQLRFHGGEDAPGERSDRQYRLAPVFKLIEVDSGLVSMRLDPHRPLTEGIGEDVLAARFDAAAQLAAVDPSVDRRQGADRRERFIPGYALLDESAFGHWLSTLQGAPIVPRWRAAMTVMTRPLGGGRTRVAVSLVNLSEDPVVPTRRRGNGPDRRHDDARDHFLFRAELSVEALPGLIAPIEMDLGPDAYRYNPRLPAYANNCGVEADRNEACQIVHLRSTPAPIHETHRALPTAHPSCEFTALASSDPLPALCEFAADMRAYLTSNDWETADLPPELASRKEEDRKRFEAEVLRFEDGIEWLEQDERLRLAFRLANRTMIRLGQLSGRAHTGWHRFQLVFIVSQLSSLAWREHEPSRFKVGLWGDTDGRDPTGAATVLWYPTGGGKTEAFLGLMACAMFYDRARGKSRGVTAWCRMPLRLLALQQTQRQLDLVAAAEEVRSEPGTLEALRAVGGDGGDRFAIGFFAGESNTPNSLSRDPTLLQKLIGDPARRQEVRLIDECPYCRRRSVEVEPPDPTTIRLIHRCLACRRELPLHIVDTEVYRYLPAVVVGTLDKLANVGLSDRFGALLGDVDCECPVHGLGRGWKCHERRLRGHPTEQLRPLAEPLYDASPTLEIIDELHMTREELGAFSAHYEGLLAQLQGRLGARTRPDGRAVRMKVIATTATIRGEDRQCDHLFGLQSVVVPLPGPSLTRSFYWEVDGGAPLRRFVGVMPHRATAEQALVRIIQALHSVVRRTERDLLDTFPHLRGLSADQRRQVLDLYRVLLTYVTSLVDFGKLRRSMDTQVNEGLRRLGMDEVRVRELSGDTSFDEVRATLDDLEGPGERLGGPGETESVIATSMVSHGVDVGRLNLMVFNGMPKTMNEYIQASSRIGRRYLGVVFIIFNPLRERDRSHFRYHGKFHEYLDRMVEPVAINRWSRFAARRTLPGVLMGEILQAVNRDWWDAGRAPAHLHELDRMQEALRPVDAGGLPSAQADPLLTAVNAVYETDRDEAAELRGDVETRVHTAVTSIRSAGAAASAARGARARYRSTGDYLGLEFDPMTSLRDVAEGLPFFTLPERRRP